MAELIEVFYLGRKAQKHDNVNVSKGAKNRVWRGFGDSKKVPADEAEVLMSHPDIWGDKAALKEITPQREAEEKEAAEREAGERRAKGRAVKEAEALREAAPTQGSTQAQDNGTEDADRDSLIKGALLALDPKSELDYTKQKKPRIDRIQEITGTSVSSDEVSIAFQELVRDGKIKVEA